MECSVALRPSRWGLRLALPIAVIAAGLFCWRGFPGVAGLLLLATILDSLVFFRRQSALPQAVFVQGMRWWLVSTDGELQGPWWLSARSRRGSLWIVLRLEDKQVRRKHRTLWIQRDMVSTEGWSRLHWEMLLQSSRQARAGRSVRRHFGEWAQRIMAPVRNRRWRRLLPGSPG